MAVVRMHDCIGKKCFFVYLSRLTWPGNSASLLKLVISKAYALRLGEVLLSTDAGLWCVGFLLLSSLVFVAQFVCRLVFNIREISTLMQVRQMYLTEKKEYLSRK